MLQQLYRHYPLTDQVIRDFHLHLSGSALHRRWLRPQVQLLVDGRAPFEPLPAAHHLPALEWGMNWCIALRCNHLLMLHAAVVARGEHAIVLPAWPGHGKSTLCAALIHSGWRLLSDEFGLVRPADGALLPLPRLIPIKNAAVTALQTFAPSAEFGPTFYATRKGDLAHLCPPGESIAQSDQIARPRWLIFPRWQAGAALNLQPVSPTQAFLRVATNAFNYETLGGSAFTLVTEMVRSCNCYSLTYSALPAAVAALETLT
nr:HprK-related kinase A [Thiospirillum jenense]